MVTKEQVATDLIRAHFEVEPYLTEVWRILSENEASEEEPIKLLEVNGATVATKRVMPFCFGPTKDVPFLTVIAEVTPQELEAIRRDPTRLPQGWSLDGGRARRFTRPDAAA